MFVLARPRPQRVDAFLAGQRSAAFSYSEVGATRGGVAPAGYTLDRNRLRLGYGAAVFERAAAALRAWRMTTLAWSSVWPTGAPVVPGTTVAVVMHHYGFWSMNACRIVYVVDDDGPGASGVRRAGFAYGTLPDHGAIGEERFAVEWHAVDDSVWYDLYAFSRPGSLLARVGSPFARRLQRRFARDSKAAMAAAASAGTPPRAVA
jgi:uncharacterized protein (UPF0548 family)